MSTTSNGSARLFTSAEMARYCQVDLKTIHNWVEKCGIPHFRTPGRHLRFKAADVVTFLRKHGYEVPCEVASAVPEEAHSDDLPAVDLSPITAVLVKFRLCSPRFVPESIEDLASTLDRALLDAGIEGPREVDRDHPFRSRGV